MRSHFREQKMDAHHRLVTQDGGRLISSFIRPPSLLHLLFLNTSHTQPPSRSISLLPLIQFFRQQVPPNIFSFLVRINRCRHRYCLLWQIKSIWGAANQYRAILSPLIAIGRTSRAALIKRMSNRRLT